MPSTPLYGLQTPTSTDPDDVPVDMARLAGQTETVIAKGADNKVMIGTTAYQRTGKASLTVSSWAGSLPLVAATIDIPVPYTPPAGWKFVITGSYSASSYAWANGEQYTSTLIRVRLYQANATALPTVTVYWQLVKD